jgi:hypothetical protein
VATASRSGGTPGSTPPQAPAPAQQSATGSHGSLPAARQDLDALLGDLSGVCGQLEELATTWRREHTSGTSRRQLPLAFPHRLQSAARQLAATLRALVEAGAGPEPDLASAAAAQLAALQGGVAAAAGDRCGHQGQTTRGRDPGTAALAGIEHTLNRVMMRQQSLISHLADITEGPGPSPASTPAYAPGEPTARTAHNESPR